MFCQKCGSNLPEDALFCHKCGSQVAPSPVPAVVGGGVPARPPPETGPSISSRGYSGVVAPSGVVSLKCPSCGASISPKFGEMLITCQYCGNGITLGSEGWRNIQKHTVLPVRVTDKDSVTSTIHALMNKGLFRWHVWERSTLEELTLSYVPYWIISVSARTSIVAVDTASQIASVAATAAILGTAAGAAQHGQRGRGGALDAAILGGVVAGSMGRGGPATKAYQMSENHNYPVIALRALFEYQPHDFEFALQERQLFDVSKLPKGVKILNGDVGEQDAKQQARTLVDQLQSEKAHKKYSMIQQLKTEIDVGDAELLHVPTWLARYRFKDRAIVVVIDGNSGAPIHTVGLDD